MLFVLHLYSKCKPRVCKYQGMQNTKSMSSILSSDSLASCTKTATYCQCILPIAVLGLCNWNHSVNGISALSLLFWLESPNHNSSCRQWSCCDMPLESLSNYIAMVLIVFALTMVLLLYRTSTSMIAQFPGRYSYFNALRMVPNIQQFLCCFLT